jgi:hypothetical protein
MSKRCIIREEVQRSNAQEQHFFTTTMAGTTAHVSGKQTFISSWLPPRFLVRENDSLQAFRTAKEYEFLRLGLSFAQTYTHKGRDPQQPTKQKVEIDHRAAPRRNKPRPLSLSQFSRRRNIQPRGALRVVVRIDSCDGIRAPSSPFHRNQRRSLYSACRLTGRNGCGREGEKEDAWLLVAWCCLDYRTYLIPPGSVVLYLPNPLPHAGSSRLLCTASFSRGSSARCGEG